MLPEYKWISCQEKTWLSMTVCNFINFSLESKILPKDKLKSISSELQGTQLKLGKTKGIYSYDFINSCE